MSALTDIFTAIANAIRGKNGTQNTYTPSQMAQAITDIPSGGEGIELVALKGMIYSYNFDSFISKTCFISMEEVETLYNLDLGYSAEVNLSFSVQGYLLRFLVNQSNLKTRVLASEETGSRGYYLGTYSSSTSYIEGISDAMATVYSSNRFKIIAKKKTITITLTITTRKYGSSYYVYWISSYSSDTPIKFIQHFVGANTYSGITVPMGSTTANRGRPSSTQYSSYRQALSTITIYNTFTVYQTDTSEVNVSGNNTLGTITGVTYDTSNDRTFTKQFTLEIIDY